MRRTIGFWISGKWRLKLRNNAGYTLVEMIIVLSITSTILLFFTHSLMNNFRFIHRSQQNSQSFTKLQVLNLIGKDYERCLKVQVPLEGTLDLKVPFWEEEDRYVIRQVNYQIMSNKLVRRETGKNEKTRILDLGSLSLNLDWKIISKVSNLVVSYSDTNGWTETYNLGPMSRRDLK
jgi:prepilin-type N-terminal cleavage/methylation domain-containing protein